jgi:hypothetical protein
MHADAKRTFKHGGVAKCILVEVEREASGAEWASTLTACLHVHIVAKTGAPAAPIAKTCHKSLHHPYGITRIAHLTQRLGHIRQVIYLQALSVMLLLYSWMQFVQSGTPRSGWGQGCSTEESQIVHMAFIGIESN